MSRNATKFILSKAKDLTGVLGGDILKSMFSRLFGKSISDGITASEIAQRISSGEVILLDVREESELRTEGMAAPAVWVATSEFKHQSEKYKQFVETTDKKKAIAVYCAGGVRSAHVASHLKEKGFNAVNLGGFRDWQAAGLPVKSFQP